MAYTKTVWTDGATPLSADNMNHIENGIAALDTGKEDKVTGKGLSTNDYTDDEKAKLAGIQAGAQVNPGAASTSAAGLMSAADKTKLNGIATGAEVNQNAFGNVKVGSTTIAADGKTDTLELAAGSNVTLTPDASNDKVTIAATNTTYSNATTSAAGLMSAADKVKLNGIAAGAEVNPGVATTSAAGLMSASDKTKLDSIGYIFESCSGSGTLSLSANSFANYDFPIPTSIKKSGYRIAVSSIMIYEDEDDYAGVVVAGFMVMHTSNAPDKLRVRVYNPTSSAKTIDWSESVASIIGFKPY